MHLGSEQLFDYLLETEAETDTDVMRKLYRNLIEMITTKLKYP